MRNKLYERQLNLLRESFSEIDKWFDLSEWFQLVLYQISISKLREFYKHLNEFYALPYCCSPTCICVCQYPPQYLRKSTKLGKDVPGIYRHDLSQLPSLSICYFFYPTIVCVIISTIIKSQRINFGAMGWWWK